MHHLEVGGEAPFSPELGRTVEAKVNVPVLLTGVHGKLPGKRDIPVVQ